MSYKKNIIPITLAVLLHVGLIGLLVWNFAFKPEKQDNQFVDSPVKARLVTAPETPKKDAASLKKRQEKQKELEEAKKKLEQKKAEEEKQKQLEAEQLKVEQEKKLAEEKQLEEQKLAQEKKAAEQKRIEDQKKAEAEKKRIAEEAEKKRKAEAEAKRKAEAERKKKAEAERKRKEAERKKREEAERKRKELEALEASLDDELFEADKGEVRQTQIMSEVEKYRSAIGAKVRRFWYIPNEEGKCVVSFKIGPGGILLDISDDGGDIEYCETGITAIKKAIPLPVSDDPEVMKILKDATIKFDPSFKQ